MLGRNWAFTRLDDLPDLHSLDCPTLVVREAPFAQMPQGLIAALSFLMAAVEMVQMPCFWRHCEFGVWQDGSVSCGVFPHSWDI